MGCMYCEENKDLHDIMDFIIKLQYSKVYLFKDQYYYGRCVVAYCGTHYDELFEIPEKERLGYMKEVSDVAQALKSITGADKINYAIYGDLVSHVHVHLVPKYKNGPEWGSAFSMEFKGRFIKEEEKKALTDKISMLLQKEEG